MNAILGWVLVLVAATAGWLNYGWQGVIVVATVAVFWLLLQFNRALKVMKNAGHAPVGYIPSAVMFNAKLKRGMPMIQVVGLAKSLGRQTGSAPETWAWADGGGATVTLVMEAGRLATWQLSREAEAHGDLTENGTPSASP